MRKCGYLVTVAFATIVGLTASSAQTGPYKLPSASMNPTFIPGTIVNVVKYDAGAQPAPGDVIAFRVPSDMKTVFLFRVVGIGGDKVQVIKGALHINGDAIKREQIADFADTDEGKPISVKQWRETPPGGASYNVIHLFPSGPFDNTAVVTVPAGHVFVLGDSRHNARDSRDASVGMIPLANVIGRVVK